MKRSRAYLIFLILTAFLATSCEDKTAENMQNNLQVTGDMLLGQQFYWDTYVIADKAARDSTLWQTGSTEIDSAHCMLLPDDAGIVIDYGTNKVLCPDGRNRQGSIILDFFTSYFNDTLNAGIRYNDFFVEERKMTGNMSITGSSGKDGRVQAVQLEISNGKIKLSDGEIVWKSKQKINWYKGMDTPFDISDDHCWVLSESQFEGTASNLIGFEASVLDSLNWSRNCTYPVQGILNISLPALEINSGQIDFGSGLCDGRVELLFAGSKIPFYFD